VESRIKVGSENVQQTTLEGGGGEEFQSLHTDNYSILTPCTTVRSYTSPCQETPTPMEVCGSSYQQECIQSLGREDEYEDDVDHGRDEYEEMIRRDDFHNNTINYENVDNVHDDVMDDHNDDAIEFHDDGVQPVVPKYLLNIVKSCTKYLLRYSTIDKFIEIFCFSTIHSKEQKLFQLHMAETFSRKL